MLTAFSFCFIVVLSIMQDVVAPLQTTTNERMDSERLVVAISQIRRDHRQLVRHLFDRIDPDQRLDFDWIHYHWERLNKGEQVKLTHAKFVVFGLASTSDVNNQDLFDELESKSNKRRITAMVTLSLRPELCFEAIPKLVAIGKNSDLDMAERIFAVALLNMLNADDPQSISAIESVCGDLIRYCAENVREFEEPGGLIPLHTEMEYLEAMMRILASYGDKSNQQFKKLTASSELNEKIAFDFGLLHRVDPAITFSRELFYDAIVSKKAYRTSSSVLGFGLKRRDLALLGILIYEKLPSGFCKELITRWSNSFQFVPTRLGDDWFSVLIMCVLASTDSHNCQNEFRDLFKKYLAKIGDSNDKWCRRIKTWLQLSILSCDRLSAEQRTQYVEQIRARLPDLLDGPVVAQEATAFLLRRARIWDEGISDLLKQRVAPDVSKLTEYDLYFQAEMAWREFACNDLQASKTIELLDRHPLVLNLEFSTEEQRKEFANWFINHCGRENQGKIIDRIAAHRYQNFKNQNTSVGYALSFAESRDSPFSRYDLLHSAIYKDDDISKDWQLVLRDLSNLIRRNARDEKNLRSALVKNLLLTRRDPQFVPDPRLFVALSSSDSELQQIALEAARVQHVNIPRTTLVRLMAQKDNQLHRCLMRWFAANYRENELAMGVLDDFAEADSPMIRYWANRVQHETFDIERLRQQRHFVSPISWLVGF